MRNARPHYIFFLTLSDMPATQTILGTGIMEFSVHIDLMHLFSIHSFRRNLLLRKLF